MRTQYRTGGDKVECVTVPGHVTELFSGNKLYE